MTQSGADHAAHASCKPRSMAGQGCAQGRRIPVRQGVDFAMSVDASAISSLARPFCSVTFRLAGSVNRSYGSNAGAHIRHSHSAGALHTDGLQLANQVAHLPLVREAQGAGNRHSVSEKCGRSGVLVGRLDAIEQSVTAPTPLAFSDTSTTCARISSWCVAAR